MSRENKKTELTKEKRKLKAIGAETQEILMKLEQIQQNVADISESGCWWNSSKLWAKKH